MIRYLTGVSGPGIRAWARERQDVGLMLTFAPTNNLPRLGRMLDRVNNGGPHETPACLPGFLDRGV